MTRPRIIFVSWFFMVWSGYGEAQDLPPSITAIFPSSDTIPVNTLRFYIQFNKPIQEMKILDYVSVVDDDGNEVDGIFFENQDELWNNNRTLVTLLVDPGRVKTGLVAHQELGWAFEPGGRYKFKVDSTLKDFSNRSLTTQYEKEYYFVVADTTAPDIAIWSVQFPRRKSKENLLIITRDQLDHISASTLIVLTNKERIVKGVWTLDPFSKKLIFTPKRRWKKGLYMMKVDPIAEDVAGNNMIAVFDRRLEENRHDKISHLMFEIK